MADQYLYVAVAISAGVINALQLAMLGGINRERGTFEATWISMLASLAGMALVLGVATATGARPKLPFPFAMTATYALAAILMTTGLLLAARGLPPYLMLTGLTSVPYLLAAAYVGPKIGLGVYFAAVVTGQLTGSTVIDHVGAFGATERHIDWIRAAGIVVLLIGVAMIYGRR